MLVTETGWEDPEPVMRNLKESYRAWHCVAWTEETLNFWVIGSREVRGDGSTPDGWLVGGPQVLLEAAADLQSDTISVYVLEHSDADKAAGLRRVTGLWREHEHAPVNVGVPRFWYATETGELRPCSLKQSPPAGRLELVSEFVFDRRAGGGT